MILVGHFQHTDKPGHTNGAATDDGFPKPHRLSVCIQEKIRCDGHWCSFSAVVGTKVAIVCRIMQKKGASADARRLRLDQSQDGFHGNRGIDCRSPGTQDF